MIPFAVPLTGDEQGGGSQLPRLRKISKGKLDLVGHSSLHATPIYIQPHHECPTCCSSTAGTLLDNWSYPSLLRAHFCTLNLPNLPASK